MSFAAILTLTTFVLSGFVLTLLPFSGERKQATAYLAALLGLICLVAALRFSILSESSWMVYLSYLVVPLSYAHGPIIYLYTRAALFEERRDPRRIWWAVLPMAAAFGAHVYFMAHYNGTWNADAFRAVQGPLKHYMGPQMILGSLYMQVWVFAAFRNLRYYRERFEERFSTEAAAQIRWLRLFLAFCAVWFCAPVALIVLGTVFPGEVNFVDSPITIVPLAIIIYMIMQHALVRPRTVPANSKLAEIEIEDREARYAKVGLDPQARAGLAAQLTEALQEDQLYLEPELSLPRLAEQLDVPAHHLSMIISLEFKMNFHGLVGLYRVREAAMLLRDPDLKDETVLALGFRAGFNSKAALNRAFKTHTGATPREYRLNHELPLPELPAAA